MEKFYEFGYKVSYNAYGKTYRSCCPICREGKSWGKKRRCFFLVEDDLIYCHNCGSSLKPYNWIRLVSGMDDDALREDIGNSGARMATLPDEASGKPAQVIPTLPEDSINLFDSTQVEFYKQNLAVIEANKVIDERRLRTAKNGPDALYISLKDVVHKHRLIIPFKDTDGKIIFYQSRKLFSWDEKASYTSKQGGDKSICGMDKIDPNFDTVFIFEGPIDSFFVKNGLAVAGINTGYHRYTQIQQDQLEELKFFKKIWVLDSQWIDKTSREKTLKLLEQGECVFIWPKNWGKYKDFNEICIKHKLDQISPSFIKDNTQCGGLGIIKCKMLFGGLL